MDAGDAHLDCDVTLRRQWRVNRQRLLTEHGVLEREVAGVEARVGPRISDRRDDGERERRVDELGRAGVAFGRERDVLDRASDRERVQRAVTRTPREGDRFRDGAHTVQVHHHEREQSSR